MADEFSATQQNPESDLGDWKSWVAVGIQVATIAARVLTAVLGEGREPAGTGEYSLGPLVFKRTKEDGTVTVQNFSQEPFMLSFTPPDDQVKTRAAELITLEKKPVPLNNAFETYAAGSMVIAPKAAMAVEGGTERAIAFATPSLTPGTALTLPTTIGTLTVVVHKPDAYYQTRVSVTFSQTVPSVNGSARIQSTITGESSEVRFAPATNTKRIVAEVQEGLQFASTVGLSLNLRIVE